MNSNIYSKGVCLRSLYPDIRHQSFMLKLLITMKLAIILTALICLQASAEVFSQKVNISVKNAPLGKVIKEIRKQSGYTFFYDAGYLEQASRVTMDAQDASVSEVLNLAFSGQPFTWEIVNKTIVIKPKPIINENSLPLFIDITGKVTDEKGEPLPGATVRVKGTEIATATDASGNFAIRNLRENAVLTVSYTGFEQQEVIIKAGQTQINIILKEDTQGLNEVVVVGYGTMRKRDLTGAVSSVKAEDLVVASSPDIGHLLKGKAAGLMIKENSAQPGGGLDILIRGAGSVNASNAPLIVVDGFPISDLQQPESGGRYQAGTHSILNSFNPNDIESIEVLKDASASSIYGSRAANGVILITTKRGTEGPPKVQYSTSFAYQHYDDSFDVLPLNEWMQVRNEAAWEQWNFDNEVIPYGSRTLEQAQADPKNGVIYKKPYTQNAINNVGAGTDWIGLVSRNGTIQQHNLSVTGGGKATRFLLSGNYFDQNGIIKNSGFKRFSLRANVDQDISKYVKLGLNLTASRINNDNSQLGYDQYENSGIIRAAIQQGPHIKPMDDEGNYPLNPLLPLQPNPLSLLTITDNGRVERMLANSFLDITPIKELTIKLKAGMDRGITKRWNYLPKTTIHGALEFGRASIAEIDKDDYLLEATANYTKTFASNHRVNFLVGASEQKFTADYNNIGNTNFISDAFLWNNLGSGSGTKVVGSSRQENMIASYFGRLNYVFKDKYLLTFTVRTDGASVFARNNKWATFPSLAVGWNVAEEPFFTGLSDVVSQFKLRVSHGQTGNASIGSNAFAAYYAYPAWLSGNDAIDIGVSLNRLENPDLKWETTTETNFGLDFSILNGRVDGTLELYNKVISDLLAIKPINSYHPVNQVMANIGETQSKGFELTINTNNLKRGDFQWRSSFIFSKFKDTWKKRADDWKPTVYESATDPIRAQYSRIADGIMQIGDVVPTQPDLIPGMIKIKDIDGFQRDANGNPAVDENGRFLRTGEPDGIIDDADTRLLGTSDPGLIAGVTNILSYKGFTLNFDFNGMFGRRMADPNFVTYGVSAEGISTYGYNALRTVKNRWTPENPSSTQPSSFYGWSPYGSGDFFLQNAWFIRLQNVSLSYELPKRVLKNIFAGASVNVAANNLLLITPYSGVDPETDSYTAAYPYMKTFTLGLNLNF